MNGNKQHLQMEGRVYGDNSDVIVGASAILTGMETTYGPSIHPPWVTRIEGRTVSITEPVLHFASTSPDCVQSEHGSTGTFVDDSG